MSYTATQVFDFCLKNQISCSEETASRFDILYEMLTEFNAHTNVTALKTESDICSRHFVDSTEKKLRFTKSVSDRFSLDAKVHPARAEELVAAGHREAYDVVVSRAVAALPVLCELCLPFVKKDGSFIAYKSAKECDKANPDSELSRSLKAIPALGAKIECVLEAPLAEADGSVSEHALLVLRKVKPTNPIYPRRYAAIVKKPL